MIKVRIDDINQDSQVTLLKNYIRKRCIVDNLSIFDFGIAVLTENLHKSPLLVDWLKYFILHKGTIFLHGVTHEDLNELDFEDIKGEIHKGKKDLLTWLGIEVKFYAPPYHRVSPNLIKACEQEKLKIVTDNFDGEKFEVVHL